MFVRVGHRPPLLLIIEDQATYRSPLGATPAAGKLLTRNDVFAAGMMSTSGDTATGSLQFLPPSVDLTTQMLSKVASRVAASQKT